MNMPGFTAKESLKSVKRNYKMDIDHEFSNKFDIIPSASANRVCEVFEIKDTRGGRALVFVCCAEPGRLWCVGGPPDNTSTDETE